MSLLAFVLLTINKLVLGFKLCLGVRAGGPSKLGSRLGFRLGLYYDSYG